MKVTDSGMPEEAYWITLFDIKAIIDWLDLDQGPLTLAEIGCGYGTFSLPIATQLNGELHAFDIDPTMVEVVQTHCQNLVVSNINTAVRDVLEQGTGLAPKSVDMVLLFNIMHSNRRTFLAEASRILKVGGRVAIIHWRVDVSTPRGPKLETRPTKEKILNDIGQLQLEHFGRCTTLKPYHWGIQLVKTEISDNEYPRQLENI